MTELKERLAHEARHDPLTGLANRSLFSLRVEAALARDDNAPAVMFLDLDDFKGVNDTLGHAAGDALLVTVAERLRASLREDDLAARLGGDEFAVLLEHAPDAGRGRARRRARARSAARAAQRGGSRRARAREHRRRAREPRGEHGRPSCCATPTSRCTPPRPAGRSRSAIFSPGMYDAELARHALVNDLREAIAHGQIKPYFQPLVELGSGRSWAVEALARWHHPRLGLLLPERFIELAEETDLINELGRGMLRAACRQAVVWREIIPGAAELVVSVNVSRLQLEDAQFAQLVAKTLDVENLPPQALMLELTESAVASGAAGVVAALHRAARARRARGGRRLRHRHVVAGRAARPARGRAQAGQAVRRRARDAPGRARVRARDRGARSRAGTDRSRPRASRPRASWRCCASSASTSPRAT